MLSHVKNCGNSGFEDWFWRLPLRGMVFYFNSWFFWKRPTSNCNSFLFTGSKEKAFPCQNAGTGMVAEPHMSHGKKRAFSRPLPGVLWDCDCSHTATHWNHRCFSTSPNLFLLKTVSKAMFYVRSTAYTFL